MDIYVTHCASAVNDGSRIVMANAPDSRRFDQRLTARSRMKTCGWSQKVSFNGFVIRPCPFSLRPLFSLPLKYIITID